MSCLSLKSEGLTVILDIVSRITVSETFCLTPVTSSAGSFPDHHHSLKSVINTLDLCLPIISWCIIKVQRHFLVAFLTYTWFIPCESHWTQIWVRSSSARKLCSWIFFLVLVLLRGGVLGKIGELPNTWLSEEALALCYMAKCCQNSHFLLCWNVAARQLQ